MAKKKNLGKRSTVRAVRENATAMVKTVKKKSKEVLQHAAKAVAPQKKGLGTKPAKKPGKRAAKKAAKRPAKKAAKRGNGGGY